MAGAGIFWQHFDADDETQTQCLQGLKEFLIGEATVGGHEQTAHGDETLVRSWKARLMTASS